MKLKRVKKYIQSILVIMTVMSIGLIGCGNSSNKMSKDAAGTQTNNGVQEDKQTSENLPIATISIEGYGDVQAELYPETAPNTVNNFISLANSGFYDNLTFHRVIKGFMIQGGDPEGNGTGGPGYSIEGEFTSNGFANSLKHTEGVLSMARTNEPDSAGSQFFIMTGTAENLDGEYAAFGKVISGMDIVQKISEVKTGLNDKPKEDIVIKSIRVDTKGIEYQEPKIIK